jgi:hypothetical protein
MMGSRPYVAPFTGSCTLAKCAEFFGLGSKGDEVIAANGKRRGDFDRASLARYGEYCNNDNALAHAIRKALLAYLPEDEQRLIDLTIQKFVRARLELDRSVIDQRLADIEHKRQVMHTKAALVGGTQTILRSRTKFAELLEKYHVDVPMKESLTTGRQTYAFAKDDEGMADLLTHQDPRVRTLAEAKIFTSSTMETKRLERFQKLYDLDILGGHKLPIPLLYYGAHPGRFSGLDKINMQNLTRVKRDKLTKEILAGHLRFALRAPAGYTIIAADLSNIEARLVATLAKCVMMREGFRNKVDLYCEFASRIYGRKITKLDEIERFVGKTCIAHGTLVLCDSGWKPIQEVTTDDQVWDGVEWVCHQGLVDKGLRDVRPISGAWLTPDHRVWSGTQWSEAQSLVRDAAILCQALDTGAECLRSLDISAVPAQESGRSLLNVIAGGLSTQLIRIVSKILSPLVALSAGDRPGARNGIGFTAKHFQTQFIGHGYLTGYLLRSLGVTRKRTECLSTTAAEVLPCTRNGARIEPRFFVMPRLLRVGMTRLKTWIESITTGTTNQAILDSQREARTQRIRDEWENLKKRSRVYDLLSAGPRHRFTIKTDDGALIVSNCILGLGYGMGWRKFDTQMRIARVRLGNGAASKIVWLYRDTYQEVPQLWGELEQAALHMQKADALHPYGPVIFAHERIILPNGMPITYPGVHRSSSTMGLVYNSTRSGKTGVRSLWGGAITENICQALARIIITDAELKLASAGLRTVLQVHDELVYCVPEKHAAVIMKAIEKVMTVQVPWLPDLPVACEVKCGPTYGDAK